MKIRFLRGLDLDSPVEVGNFVGGKLEDEKVERKEWKKKKESRERRERGCGTASHKLPQLDKYF